MKTATLRQAQISLLWLAFNAQWLTILPILIPDQVSAILGASAANREGVTGTIAALGALVALLVAPLAGALSDRSGGARGRRRLFLIVGIAGSCVALALLIPFGPGGSIVLYGLAILHLQFWWNWAAGPYAGLVPDVMPQSEQAGASAWLNVMSVAGAIVGNALIFASYAQGQPAKALSGLIAITLACLWFTLRVAEPPAIEDPQRFEIGAFLRSFLLKPGDHPNFYWVLVTRLVSNMGVWSVFTFLLFYLQDVIGVEHPEQMLPVLLGAGAILAVPASFLGVRWSAKYGVVRTVQATSWIMAAAVSGYVLVALRPDIRLAAPLILIYAAAYGAYQAADWALALRVLPARASAGKDMGIWHISMVLPQIVGPASIGWIISGVRNAVTAPVAYTVAFGIAAFWFVLAALLVGRVRLAPDAAS